MQFFQKYIITENAYEKITALDVQLKMRRSVSTKLLNAYVYYYTTTYRFTYLKYP